eukprot:TRINITY_DN1599_c0_g1_i3.p1 TRINITY_DN1599_c0_g1~~TRINITY_DN1599_c0_g1_i3.p1  ORF type:complete len:435 (-),score=127.73 TRINITY_DN1599_c0_g1_i3:118-1422(-)
MDKIVGNIQNLSGNEADLKQLKSFLTKEEALIQKNLNYIDDALNTLDPSQHSLGYAFLLGAKASTQKIEPQKYLIQAVRFINTANALQIRLAPAKVAVICRRLTELAVESTQSMKAVKILRTAIKKVKPTSESLTPVHADFLQVCLLSKCYHAALPILEEEVFEVNPDLTAITPKDMLLYYYYGGMVLTGLKEYKRALGFFRQATSAPALVLSAIMVEAYKKYVLLSLLVHGKLVPLPKYASSVMQRHHKTGFPQYQELANAYSTFSTDDLHKCAETNSEIFIKDKNLGLVKQCIQSLYRRNIQRLTQTYITLSLQDIATSVKLASPKEAERHIVKMIETGEIFATINQKDGMVSFQENPEHYDTNRLVGELDHQIQKVIDLGKKVRTLDETIASSAQYIQKSTMHERGGGRWGAEAFDDFEAEKPGIVGGKLM